MTQHIELYKKYRPETWEDLIGQEKVANSLRNAVKYDKLPTTYGMFGPRGCGKTSSAFILAKAVNCENPDNGNPCNTCETCISIDNNTQVGVTYISMANKGSVEDVRELVQRARLKLPVKKQVWILDEIHNLSKTAFDSLLIPIEATDMPSLFIFCSTEVDKIPQTIISRIQPRRFTLVASDEMEKFVRNILEKENITLDESLIQDSIRQGRGSVRDTLSALEALIDTGEISTSVGGQLIEAIAERNIAKAMALVAEGNNEGYDGRDLAEQLFSDLRNILLTASGVDSSLIGVIPVTDPIKTSKALLGKQGIVFVVDEIGNAITRMSMGADSRIHLEIALVKSIEKLTKLKKALAARG